MKKTILLLAVFSSLLFLTAKSSFAQTQVAGIAQTPEGKPFAHARLDFLSSEGLFVVGGRYPTLIESSRYSTLTDGEGRFTISFSAVPPILKHLETPKGQLEMRTRETNFSVLISPFDFSQGDVGLADPRDQGAISRISKSAQITWEKKGDNRFLLVTTPEPGNVEVDVRDSEGKPVRSTPVILLTSGYAGEPVGLVVLNATTTAEGKLRLRQFAGDYTFNIYVPNVGFGKTGLLEVVAGRTSLASLPKLAPFASIKGTVASVLRGPNTYVRVAATGTWMEASYNSPWPNMTVRVGWDGRFTIPNAIPGVLSLQVRGNANDARSAIKTLWLAPGEKRENLELGPAPVDEPPSQDEANTWALPPLSASHPVIRGKVVDRENKPVANAGVFAVWGHTGYPARTDANGRYEIKNIKVSVNAGPFWLIACRPDYPPVILQRTFDRRRARPTYQNGEAGHVLDVDVTLPAMNQLSSLAVRVVRKGAPVFPAEVVLRSSNNPRSMHWGFWSWAPDGMWSSHDTWKRSEAGERLSQLLQPVRLVDKDGVARFDNLLPGDYAIKVTHPPMTPEQLGNPWRNQKGIRDTNVIRSLGNIPVNAGGQNEFSVDLFSAMDVLDVPFIRSDEMPSHKASKPPASQARALLKVSLRDRNGVPSSGTVILENWYGDALQAGTTDDNGEIRFEGVVSGETVYIQGYLKGASLPSLELPDTQNQPEALPRIKYVQEPGKPGAVVLRPVRVGYLSGRVHLPQGERASEFSFQNFFQSELPTQFRYNRSSGHYFIGPLPAGILDLRQTKTTQTTFTVFAKDVLIPAGKAVTADVEPLAVTQQSSQKVFASLTPHQLAGIRCILTLADGKTPVVNARCFLYLPGFGEAHAMSISDANGHVLFETGDTAKKPQLNYKPGPSRHHTMVVVAHGVAGTAVVNLPDASRKTSAHVIHLPQPVTLSGRVTMNGQNYRDSTQPSTVNVARLDAGNFNEVLGFKAAIQSNGQYSIRGLAVGKYQVTVKGSDISASDVVILDVKKSDENLNLDLNVVPGNKQ